MKVFFNQGYSGPARGQLPGEEVRVKQEIQWAGERWLVPSVYVCGQGLVVDLCRPVAWARMQAFIDRWDLLKKPDEVDFTLTERRQIALEHPLQNRLQLKIQVNGRALRATQGSGFSYMMDLSKGDPDAEEMLLHYQLDRGCAWAFFRQSFSWATTRKPRIREVMMTLVHDCEKTLGPQLTLLPGETAECTHPVTGVRYALRVLEMKKIDILEGLAAYSMAYQTDPALKRTELRLEDSDEGVSRRLRRGGAIGWIGGGAHSGYDIACSSVYEADKLPEHIAWQTYFYTKTIDDAVLRLI